MIQKISDSYKCCSYDLQIKESWNKCIQNQRIRIISDGSCDTDDLSYDAENAD